MQKKSAEASLIVIPPASAAGTSHVIPMEFLKQSQRMERLSVRKPSKLAAEFRGQRTS